MTTKKELLATQNCAKQTDNNTSESLFKVYKIDDSPFGILERDNEFKIILGNEIVSSNVFDSFEHANSYISGYCWDVIFSAIYSLVKNFDKLKEHENS